MHLQRGTRLGPYEIVARAGAGGMGEVYRARDTRLARMVAIKVLPAEFATDPRLRARLESEAQAISALNHPHICTLHDVGGDGGVEYLVLEFCEGQTLRDRLDRGALPVEQVVRYGIEIADALAAAHRAGVVHRDLKPSNIMLTRSGAKLLDFGLARHPAVEHPRRPGDPTTSVNEVLPDDGAVAGTLPYMAPEVVVGKEADLRSDIFALGVILYEMLTARRAFAGESRAAIIAAILEHEPTSLRKERPDSPPLLDHLIEGCLRKEPDARWQSAHDIAEELRWIAGSAKEAGAPARRRWSIIAALLMALIAIGVAVTIPRLLRDRAGEQVIRLSVPLAEMGEAAASGQPQINSVIGLPDIAVSPDGTRIAYFATLAGISQLYVRRLDTFESVHLPMSDSGGGPFFSPDGAWIGFVSARGLRKIAVTGGEPGILYNSVLGLGRGGTWAPDGTIYFSPGTSTGIWKVSANGGAASEVTRMNLAEGETSHRFPQVLPDGKHLVFTIRTDRIASFDEAKIAVLSLETGKWRVVFEGGTCARYVATGHLLFGRAGALYAVPFDLASLSVTGTPRKVVEGLMTSSATGAASFDVGERGDLAYVSGGPSASRSELLTVDDAGEIRSTVTLPVAVDGGSTIALSPDGRRIAFSALFANNDIWTYDLESGTGTRFSFEPGDERGPIWTADGSHIIYAAVRPPRLLIKKADGGGAAEELLRSDYPSATSCSPDGQLVSFIERSPVTGFDLWTLPLQGDRKPQPLVRTPFQELDAVFSPDGHWIAYDSNDSGTTQVYVRTASPGGGRWQLSSERGQLPQWSFDGKEVFYLSGDRFYAAPVSATGNELRPGKARLLFTMPDVRTFTRAKNHFLIVRDADQVRPRQINVVLHWQREVAAN